MLDHARATGYKNNNPWRRVQAGKKISVRTQQFRYDDAGKLFDMVADLGQTNDITTQHSERFLTCPVISFSSLPR